MIPYEGKDPYVFISYAHKDAQIVVPLIEEMTRAGFRLWYDSGVEVGTEWPQFIAEHLQGCHAVLMLASKYFDESVNCRNELAFALAQKKSVVVLHLEDAALSFGTQLQISSFQQIYFSRLGGADALINELMRASLLKPCLKEKSEKNDPLPPPEKQTDDTVDPKDQVKEAPAQESEAKNEPSSAPTEKDTPSSETKTQKKTGERSKTPRKKKEKKLVINDPNFIVEGSVLKEYLGSDGEVTVPDGVTEIGIKAFYENKTLKSVVLPPSVLRIGDSAFKDCSCLKNVTLSAELTYIGVSAFSACAITRLTIPKNVLVINRDAFSFCEKLRKIEVDKENYWYRSESNCLIHKATATLIRGCKTSVIPDSVKKIGSDAFYGCRGLKEITIPDSVDEIQSYAFAFCDGLESITIPHSVQKLGDRAFSYCRALRIVKCPTTLTIPQNAFPKYTEIIRKRPPRKKLFGIF